MRKSNVFNIAVTVNVLLALCAILPHSLLAKGKDTQPPNIILILADDFSYGDISHFGQKEFSTPNIDRMAREGMVFSNAYAAAPECAPSRAGLLTGRDMGHCTFRRLMTDVRPKLHKRPYLLPDDETIAHVLGSAGYTTCQIGKWHVGEPGTPGMPHLQGFEHSLCFDHENNKRAQYIYPTRLWRNGVAEEILENKGFNIGHPDNRFDKEGRFAPGGMPNPSAMRYCEDIYIEEAIKFLRTPHKKPFFMYYASTLTHAEWPKELRELKDKSAPWTDDQKRWAGQVTHMDRSVGAILNELKAQGLDQNTLVLFTSDNGYSAWGYTKESKVERWKDDPVLKNKGPWDRGKFIATNGGVIVPFIAWSPGMVKAGETERAVSCYDLKATFAAMADTTAAKTDGVSFLPLLSGHESDVPQRDFLYWEQGGMGRNVQSVLLDERFFALRMNPGDPVRVFEIFDDPGCKQDLASQRQDLVERAEKLFVSNRTENPWYPNLTAAIKKEQSAIKARANNSAQVKTDIDWSTFLARHDMIWTKLPGNWREAPWTGNGMIGSMSWVEKDALRLQVFRGDVQAHRPMTQGVCGYTRARLQIGSFYLKPAGKPVGCDLRLSLHDAEVSGIIASGEGGLNIRQFTHAEDMVIVTELESGDAPATLAWKPASSMPTRPRYATQEPQLKKLQKQYKSKYPTEVFHPNPDPVLKVVDGVNVCIQDMLGGSRHVTAWKMIKPGKGKQRLVVSIANRWPKETNDPLAEAVAAVRKVCDLNGKAYDAWKQKHYDWWHGYYPAGFVSVPDTGVETMYWTTMYKLGSATRSDRVMIDTAGIWQTPSRWADSHWDFNIPYCYYPMSTANRVELGNSLIRPFSKYQDNLIKNVRPVEWQTDSSYLPVCTGMDLYQPKDVDNRNFNNTGGHLVWAMHACWLIYRGNMDDDILRDTIYPIMKRAANYQIHRLVKRDGTYHAPKSHSPEYGDAPDANYELAMLRWICHAIIASGTRLNVEKTDLAKYRDILANLADYPVDERGYMVGEGMPFDKPHRHWCHMQMIHPLQLVTGKTPEERELMERSMNNFDQVNRKAKGTHYLSGAAAFTFNGLSAIAALLGDGDRALLEIHRFMNWPPVCANSMYQEANNPCFESPIYVAHNIHEMLLQCYDEFPESGEMQATIRVFPAVPSTWPGAVFHNLRAMGAFLVSAEHKDGQTQWVRVKSLHGEPCRIKPNLPGTVRVSGERAFELHDVGDGIYTLDLKKGEEALLYTGDTVPAPTIKPFPAQEGKGNRYGLRSEEK